LKIQRLQFCACLLAALLAVSATLSCSSAPRRKDTFVGQADGGKEQQEVPVGLNPLGSLDTCGEIGPAPADESRVLVSRPEYFTMEASRMILSLREALGNSRDIPGKVSFLLSPGPLETQEKAVRIGQECQALIVLWEPGYTKTLRLTLPQPSQVPLRSLARERLCEFGNHGEQLNILYTTIAGLLAMRENDYDKAVIYLEAASQMDDHCLKLPGGGTGMPGADPGARG